MIFPLYIARRYLFSKKSHNVINIISFISVFVVGAVSFALIVVLSAFNGLENLVESLYSSFDPAIRITVKEGKVFDHTTFPQDEVRSMEGVADYSRSLEETVYLEYGDKESLATVKGVDDAFLDMSGLDSMMYDGNLVLEDGAQPYAVMGYGIAANMGVFIGQSANPIRVYAAKRTASVAASPENAFMQRNIMPAGVFSINVDFDNKYILVPFEFAAELLEYDTQVSSIELGLKPEADPDDVKQNLQALLGSDYEVKTRYELNEIIFKTNKTEKLMVYLILTFILVIAIFNVIGSLTMLILDKKDDVNILKSMGASKKTIRNIFLLEGLLINFVGAAIGLGLGLILCLLQQHVGLFKLDNIIVDYYPVLPLFTDVILILATVMLIGWIASWFPVRFVVRRQFV